MMAASPSTQANQSRLFRARPTRSRSDSLKSALVLGWGCDNGDKVRVAFALDCCDREVMGFVATTEGIKCEDVRDLMVTAVERNMPEL